MNEIITKNGIKYGIIAGVVSILIYLGIYLFNLQLFAAWWLGISLIIFYIAVGVYAMIVTKRDLNGNYSFKEAFTTYFMYALVGIFISTAFNIILFNVIDPSLKETVKEISIEASVNMMKKFNTPSAQMKEVVAQMKEQDQFGVMSQLKGIIFGVLMSSIAGAILAAIFKSKKQEVF